MAKRITGSPVGMVIEWGQLDSGLNAIRGALEGVAGTRTVKELAPRLRQEALKDFGQKADALSLNDGPGSIAHTYEWGLAGTPAGRLWVAVPNHTGAFGGYNFIFRDSIRRVPLGGSEQTHSQELASASEAGVTRAVHVWKRKASDQEYRRSWTVEAGQASPETQTKPGSSSPTKFLRILQENGEVLYRRRWRNYSKYTGNFTTFFEGFWSAEAPQTIERELNDGFERKVRPAIEREVTAVARATGKIRPDMIAAPGVFKMYSNGKPFTGKMGNRPNKTIAQRIRKRMKETWR